MTSETATSYRTRIKLCGMTRAEDVRLAVGLGVDIIGLIFARRSPRRLSLERAAALRALAGADIRVVALVMDDAADAVVRIVEAVRPDFLQFHGAEDDAFCASSGLPFFKSIAMGGGTDPVEAMARFPSAYGFVLDGHAAGEAGGSGRRFDWAQLPTAANTPILLAGGLTAENVGEAIRTAQPWGVDVSSGIESAPGVKDPHAMRAFVAAARGLG